MSIERKKDKTTSRLWDNRLENEMVKTLKKEIQPVLEHKLPSPQAFLKMKMKIMREIAGITPERRDIVMAAESELKEKVRTGKKNMVKLARKLNKTKENLKNKPQTI